MLHCSTSVRWSNAEYNPVFQTSPVNLPLSVCCLSTLLSTAALLCCWLLFGLFAEQGLLQMGVFLQFAVYLGFSVVTALIVHEPHLVCMKYHMLSIL